MEQTDTKTNPKTYIEQSVEGMKQQQQIHMSTWGLNGENNTSWNVDLETGIIIFEFPDKIVTANVQVIGTLHDGTFMWGWEHPSVPPTCQKDALLAKEWGKNNALPEYSEHVVDADETKAWEFTAVAARLAEATGTYSGQTGDTRVFMTFGPITMKPLSN